MQGTSFITASPNTTGTLPTAGPVSVAATGACNTSSVTTLSLKPSGPETSCDYTVTDLNLAPYPYTLCNTYAAPCDQISTCSQTGNIYTYYLETSTGGAIDSYGPTADISHSFANIAAYTNATVRILVTNITGGRCLLCGGDAAGRHQSV